MDIGATIVVYIFSSLNKKRILIGSSLIFGTSQKRRPEPDFKKVIFLQLTTKPDRKILLKTHILDDTKTWIVHLIT